MNMDYYGLLLFVWWLIAGRCFIGGHLDSRNLTSQTLQILSLNCLSKMVMIDQIFHHEMISITAMTN
ncbi:MAG: hypothetical protein CMO80_21810 [Verrucomicrobiales bacterium]|nr:hypothetical protein [Verrucomicrobiales bacterium]